MTSCVDFYVVLDLLFTNEAAIKIVNNHNVYHVPTQVINYDI